MSRKKVLVFVDWFIPAYKAGGPVTSMLALADAAHLLHIDLYIITGDRDLGDPHPFADIQPDVEVRSTHPHAKVYYLSQGHSRWSRIRSLTKQINPDVVYVNGIFSLWFSIVPVLMHRLGFIKNKLVVCPRGMLGENTLRIKQVKKKVFLTLMRMMHLYKGVVWHATNTYERDCIREHTIHAQDIQVINNLPSVMPTNVDVTVHKKVGEVRLLFYSRILPVKNLLFLLQVLQAQQSGTIHLDIVGPAEDALYWEECRQLISILPSHIHVNYLGSVNVRKNPVSFSMYHFMVLPTLHENYGHAIAEALASGCPVMISDHTPWNEVENKNAGFVRPLTSEAWAEALEIAIEMDEPAYLKMAADTRQYFIEKVDYQQLIQQYKLLFS